MRGRWRARRAACERRRRWELPALARSPRAGLGRLGHSYELGLAAAVSVGRDERRGESRLGWFEEERKKDFPFLIICDLGNLGRGILAEAWKSSKWDLR